MVDVFEADDVPAWYACSASGPTCDQLVPLSSQDSCRHHSAGIVAHLQGVQGLSTMSYHAFCEVPHIAELVCTM